jgi:hypothetical protein
MWFKILSVFIISAFSLNAQFPSFLKQKVKKEQKPVAMVVSPQSTQAIQKNPPKCEVHHKIVSEQPKVLHEAILKTENAPHCSINMDLLYWKPIISSWIVGAKTLSFSSIMLHKNVNWAPGAKLAINFSNVYDWTIGADGTYYKNATHMHTLKPLEMFNSISYDTRYRGKIMYSNININFSSQFMVNKTISLIPVIGAEYVLIKSKTITDELGLNFDEHQDPNPADPVNSRYISHTKFLGFGPKVGCTGIFKLGTSDFNFFGTFIGSLAYGNNKNSLIPINYLTDESSLLKNNFHHLKGSMQLIAGLEWKHHFTDTNYSFGLHLAYEANLWFDISNISSILGNRVFFNSPAGSNFTIQGGNVGLSFDF